MNDKGPNERLTIPARARAYGIGKKTIRREAKRGRDSRPASPTGSRRRPTPPAAERSERHPIQSARKVGRPSKYRPDHHPRDLVAYFRAAHDAIDELERVKSGGGRWIQRPVAPPTMTSYAAKVGVRRETLCAWRRRYPEFAKAVGVARAIQEDLVIRMGALGAYPPRLTLLVLRNLRRGMDRVERKLGGGVTLLFEASDAKASASGSQAREAALPKTGPVPDPEHLIDYFQTAYAALEEPERIESSCGAVRWIQRPIAPPTLAGYAAKLGVGRETLWAWAQQDPEFAQALEFAQTIEEDLWIVLGLLGVYHFSVVKFVLEKLLRWTDHAEPKRAGGITLLFDAEDKRRP